MTKQLKSPDEFATDLRSFDEFSAFAASNPWLFDRETVEKRAGRICRARILEPLTNHRIPVGELECAGINYRETLAWRGRNSRCRALMKVIEREVVEFGMTDPEIYMPEAVTAFAQMMAQRFPRFVGSEYAGDEDTKRRLPGVRLEDLMALSFSTNAFDIVASNDVLEHVPDIDVCLREILRVLRPGGIFASNVPFAAGSPTSIKRARLAGGRVEHMMEPEYHGNPVDPNGSLVFEIPGWDILQRALDAGAADAWMHLTGSIQGGYVGADEACIYLLMIRKRG